MKTKQPNLPRELQEFIDEDHTTFYCDDGDWDLRIAGREKSDFKDELPPRSIMIAENGCGDCLFLKTSAVGKIDSKVFVYWHEEERHEVFAKHIKELTAQSSPQESSTNKPVAGNGKKTSYSLKELERALASSDALIRQDALLKLYKSDFGIEAVPLLRKALADTSALVASEATRCIAKLGPEAATSAGGQQSDATTDYTDLAVQLMALGGKIWSHSGYANLYGDCLEALLKIGCEDEYIVEYVHNHIGLGMPDHLIDSLEALKTIGTAEAIDLLKRAATFWMPELNMAYAKKVKAIVGSAKVLKKK
jgi:hypothetical protein